MANPYRALALGMMMATLTAALLAPTAVAQRVVVRDYIVADGQVTTFQLPCASDLGAPLPAVNLVCIPVLAGETSVSIVVDDATDVPVFAFSSMVDANGNSVAGRIFFCGSTTRAVPAAAASLRVGVEPVWAGTLNLATGTGGCSPNFGTTGTVTATFN